MKPEVPERRRSPRFDVLNGEVLRLIRRVRVRLLDISTRGVLLAPEEPLPVGSRGRMRVVLGGHPFEAHLEVSRGESGEPPNVVGAVMASDRNYQQTLEQFLSRASRGI